MRVLLELFKNLYINHYGEKKWERRFGLKTKFCLLNFVASLSPSFATRAAPKSCLLGMKSLWFPKMVSYSTYARSRSQTNGPNVLNPELITIISNKWCQKFNKEFNIHHKNSNEHNLTFLQLIHKWNI